MPLRLLYLLFCQDGGGLCCWRGVRPRRTLSCSCCATRSCCCAGIETWSDAAGATRTGVAARRWPPSFGRWCCGWQGEPDLGVSPHPRWAMPTRRQVQKSGRAPCGPSCSAPRRPVAVRVPRGRPVRRHHIAARCAIVHTGQHVDVVGQAGGCHVQVPAGAWAGAHPRPRSGCRRRGRRGTAGGCHGLGAVDVNRASV